MNYRKFKQLLRSVINEVDPMGIVYGEINVNDEYDSEVNILIPKLKDQSDIRIIESLIKEVFILRFGQSTALIKPNSYFIIAQKILDSCGGSINIIQ